jgi:dimethylhistidine N-methyltransferase
MAKLRYLQSLDRADREFSTAGDEARAELTTGLTQKQARISPKYFYNALGSKLFEAVCQLDEYYLTRVEASIFANSGEQLRSAVGTGVTLIDLGAGNCAKATALFDVLAPQQYVPVDISVEFLGASVEKLRVEYPEIPMLPVALDFADCFQLPPAVRQDNRLFFYPGSSIGNFTPLQATRFLRRLHVAGKDSAILIGVDLVKDHAALEAAYDDALGVTAAFNLNALLHVNQLLGSDFAVRSWRHRALFNAEQSRVEMYLEALQDATVRWPGDSRNFTAGERIHTENSYKYTQQSFTELLKTSGFAGVKCWTDDATQFLVCYARAV